MDFSFRYDLWYARLPKSPADAGRVELLVVRPADGASGDRATPAQIEVQPHVGVVGDRWRPGDALGGDQVSLMNVHVLRSICEDEAQMPLAGDNLVVDLDLSEANLPVGTRLSVGDALLEVSPELHRPCAKFHQRFGKAAARKVARANQKGHRGRGVLCTVIQPGTIRLGDIVTVQRD
ncbi:MAG: MOSC domain-containing protein [Planctomycetota bacterium]